MRTHALVAALALGIAIGGLDGCKKKPPPPPPPPPPAPKYEPPPDVDVQALLQEMNADARVQFPEENAPTSQDLARAIIGLANCFAKGDADSLAGVLDPNAQRTLNDLRDVGDWDSQTKSIEAVRVTYLQESGDAGTFAIAIQDPKGAYALLWNAAPTDGAYTFRPMPTQSGDRPRASDWDGVNPMYLASIPAPTVPTTPAETDEEPEESDDEGGGGRTTTSGG